MDESSRPFELFSDRYLQQNLPVSSNPTSKDAPGPDTFTRFQELPLELRTRIWQFHVPSHQRFLRVYLDEVTTEETAPFQDAANDDDSGEWGALFSSTVPEQPETQSTQLVAITFLDSSMASGPVLPRVCREAYEVFQSVYRIRLPALVRVPSNTNTSSVDMETKKIVAYLDPDYDILSIETHSPSTVIQKNLLPYFLHTLLQHDSSPASLRFGIRNLCLDFKQLGDARESDIIPGFYDPDEPAPGLSPDVLASVRTTASHLRKLFFRLITKHLEPRVTSGPLTGSGAQPWYNASVPILPPVLWNEFPSRVHPVEGGDIRLEGPKDIADLHQVWIGSEIKPSMDVWEDLERAWGVRCAEESDAVNTSIRRDLNVRALIALEPDMSRNIRDYLQQEKTTWFRTMDATTDWGELHRPMFERAQQRFISRSTTLTDESIGAITPEDWYLQRREKTAAGFWLVDPDVLGAAATKGAAGKRVVDLSAEGNKAVDLWVFHRNN